MATTIVGASFAVVGCGGAIPVGTVPVFASGTMQLTADSSFNGEVSNLTDPEAQATLGENSSFTLTKEGREITVTVPTDRPVMGQLFNLHSSSSAVRYSEGTKIWNLGSGYVRFGASEGGPALFFRGTLSPGSESDSEGTAAADAIYVGTGVEIQAGSSDNKAEIYAQVGEGDITEVLSGTGLGRMSTTGPTLSLTYEVGDQRLIARWDPSGTPGQNLSGFAEVEYNPDINGSTGYIEASSGKIYVYYDSESGQYRASLVNVVITVDSTTYRFDGFISGVWPS